MPNTHIEVEIKSTLERCSSYTILSLKYEADMNKLFIEAGISPKDVQLIITCEHPNHDKDIEHVAYLDKGVTIRWPNTGGG